MSATKPRYMLRTQVVEIDAEGEERATFWQNQTNIAIADAYQAQWIAGDLINIALDKFSARADSSPVTPHEGG